tara:strand:+ start:2869 stop:7731 length:4863 start_codon:yes stop_codon:yes gene_type:complete
LALPGITNSNEFYSPHYLESVLTSDIKKVFKRWTDDAKAQLEENPHFDVSTPDQRFKALRNPWQKLRESEHGIKNDPAERLRLQREVFFRPLCDALGYTFTAKSELILVGGEAYQIPLLGEVLNGKGEPLLWLVECFNPSDETLDPLELSIVTNWGCQINDPSLGYVFESENWERLISERVFGQEIPPRWVIAVSRDQLVLIDRQKWAASRLLRFDLDSLLGDYNHDALIAATTLLHREHTCPSDGGTPYLDELDENSHKHAYEVSDDLKYALRKSIELIGNEAIYWRKTRNEGVFKGKTDAEQLTLECLRYMYRLLFLFYIESRPDLGYAPMGSDVYRMGYSLESLREMDTSELVSEEDKESTYISDSLDRLFQMIWEGYPKRDDPTEQILLTELEEIFHDNFRLTPLRAHLFDPDRLPTLTHVRFRNLVLRDVIELMSLTKERKGKRRGRVSYSQLGINQLGAVYEALLSFRGFFAEEDLFEVQPALNNGKSSKGNTYYDHDSNNGHNNVKISGAVHDELDVTHFVTAEQLKDYKPSEIVPDLFTGNPKCFIKGSFIYRLAGREREKSASYYTPEPLTQCLVKYSLKELLPGKTAFDILKVKVCEPAMGSAAFLNEAVNQLSQAYLDLRQKEIGRRIPHDHYSTELQKVKMRLVDQNVFGIDLNSVAVELAEVSLWLNSIFTPERGRAFVPWFSQQLLCGNSLIGARRQIYRVNQLPTSTARNAQPRKLWHNYAPEELAWDTELPEDGIFHFLLPDPGMAAYNDKLIKQLEPKAIEHFKRWKKNFVGDIFTEAQIAHLHRLSKLVDVLWKDWASEQQKLRNRTTDPLPVWEGPADDDDFEWTPLKRKDRIQEQEVQGCNVNNTNARLRLKWAMDYWVSLWFWPINQFRLLPTRDSWLLELSMILGDLEQGISSELGQVNLFPDTQPKKYANDFFDRYGFVDVEKLKSEFIRLQEVSLITKQIKPLHWDLEFSDVLAGSGFDLIIGNPPWSRAQWNAKEFISECSPLLKFRKLSAAQVAIQADQLLKEKEIREDFLKTYVIDSGIKEFCSCECNYSVLKGQSGDIAKNFIALSWRLSGSKKNVIGLIHQFGIYDDAGGHIARNEAYSRLRFLFHYRNKLRFFDIKDTRNFVISVFSYPIVNVKFKAIFKAIHPKTIDESLNHLESLSTTPIPKEKDTQGNWNLRGHKKRVIVINKNFLEALVGDNPQVDNKHQIISPKLPQPYSDIGIEFTNKMKKNNLVLGSLKGFDSSMGLNESSSQKIGLIEKRSDFAVKGNVTIITGANIHICNSIYKSAMEVCTHHSHFWPIHPLSSEYIKPRTLYQQIGLDNKICTKDKLLSYYRIAVPRQIDPNTERTLQPCIIPPGWTHIDGIISFLFSDIDDLIIACGLLSSTTYDYYMKTSGATNFLRNTLELLPFPLIKGRLRTEIIDRVILLNCQNSLYSDLLREIIVSRQIEDVKALIFNSTVQFKDQWQVLQGEQGEFFKGSDLARAYALAEIDVLSAIATGISKQLFFASLHEGFSIFLSNSNSTYFDSKGLLSFTPSKALSTVGFQRRDNSNMSWSEALESSSSMIERYVEQKFFDGPPIQTTINYFPPFKLFNREEIYSRTWEKFSCLTKEI